MAIYKRLFVFWICMYTFLLTEGFLHLGCYHDSKEDRVLEVNLKKSVKNTPEECARLCRDYRYAGVENGDLCFCGNTLNNPQITQTSECNTSCSGDKNKTCGGLWKISVYTKLLTACGPLPTIANGNATLAQGSNLTYGSIADIYCNPGFIGKPTITCLSSTSWEKATCKQQSTTSSPVTTPTSTTQNVYTTVKPTTTRATSSTKTPTSTVDPVTSLITTQSTSTTNGQTSGTTYTSGDTAPTTTKAISLQTATSPTNIQSTTSLSEMDGKTAASKQQVSKGSSTTAVAAGVSVTIALAVAAVVIVLVLRNKKKTCFANTKRSNLENRDDDNHISLQNDLYQAPGAPVINRTYSGLDSGNIKSKEHEASAFTDVTYQNTNNKHGNHVSEAHAYFVLEKDGFELKRNAVNSTPTDVHDYFVLEKQQPNFGNRNGVLTNEAHPYFVLDKQGDQPVHDRPPNEANPYFVLEKQTTGNPPPIHTANALALKDTDGDTYQEIDTDDTYAGIDDSREDNNDYDYTNKAFKDSRTEISDNVYNHLNAAGDEYDHLGKWQSNDEAMENNYDVTSSAV